jgi:hypothetical protein
MRAILFAISLCLLAHPAASESQQVVFGFIPCDIKVDFEPREHMLHVRVPESAGTKCGVEPEKVAAALDESLSGRDDLQSIFLGRLVDYPWLSKKLVERAIKFDYIWDAAKGHERSGNDNAFVSFALFVTGLYDIGPQIEPFETTLGSNGYIVEGVSAEKVMTKSIDGHAGRFPFDALVHLSIKKVR